MSDGYDGQLLCGFKLLCRYCSKQDISFTFERSQDLGELLSVTYVTAHLAAVQMLATCLNVPLNLKRAISAVCVSASDFVLAQM